MAVKLELYRVFQEVAKMGNISAAAQNLYISQSAVSQSIKQLEEQLQVRLFSRSTRGVMLTSEGRTLLEYVTRALGLIQNGEEKLAQSRQLLTGELIIGASDTVTKNISRLASGGVPQGISGHPHPHPERHEPDGARLSARRSGGYRLCKRRAGRGGLLRAPLRGHAYHLCRRAGL